MNEFDPVLTDTTPDAAAVYYEALRQMPPEERVRRGLEASDQLRDVLEAGVRQRHPDYDDRQVKLAAIRHRLGDTLFREVYPGVEVEL
ncbi:MAG: hypothetical protein KJZ87_00150 [Thermoguttaceae bacterium]|nr:hypothetical protein [Thermoguttaceae bacterium]